MERLKEYCWGSHAYIVFGRFYGEYIRRYEKKNGDPADFMFEKSGNVYVTAENLFIQYTRHQSMNRHSGYILDNRSMKDPPKGFSRI